MGEDGFGGRAETPGAGCKRGLIPVALAAVLTLAAPAQAARLVAVTVEPATLTLAPGEQHAYRATAHFDDGTTQDITSFAEWTTSSSRLARVSADPASPGLVTARDPGEVEIRAALLLPGGSKEKGAAVLTVFAGALTAIRTRPSSKQLEVGIDRAFKARAIYASGYESDITAKVVWSSSDPSIATVGPSGLVHPLRAGTVTIEALEPTSGIRNTDGQTTVRARVVRLSFDPASLVLGVGMRAQLRVLGERADGTRSTLTDEVRLVASRPGLIDVFTAADATTPAEEDRIGEVTGLAEGSGTINAFDPVRGLDTRAALGGAGDASFEVEGRLASLVVTPDPFRLGIAETRGAHATGVLSTGRTTSELRKLVTWSVADPAVATVAPGGKVTGLAVGVTTLRAVDPATGVASAPVALNVRGAVTSVSIEPTRLVLARGIEIPLKAYANRSDGTRSNVTAAAEWSVSPAGIVAIEGPGRIRALADGSARISARDPRSGISSSASGADAEVEVSGDLEEIHVASLRVPFGERRKARATGLTSTGATTSDLREALVWSVEDPAIADVGNAGDPGLAPGEVEARAAGTTTLRARDPASGLVSPESDNLRVSGEIVSVALERANGGLVPVDVPVRFKARATLSDGSKSNVSDKCVWSVDDPAVAAVDDELPDKGTVTGLVFGGRTIVRIDCAGHAASGSVEVIGELVSVEVRPAEFEGRALRQKQFRAVGHYAGGYELDITKQVRWLSTDPRVATVDDEADPGQVSFLANGSAEIVATAATGQSGISRVTVAGGPVALRISPTRIRLRGSTQRRLRAIAIFADGDERPANRLVEWSSSDENVARLADAPEQAGTVIGGAATGRATVTASWPGGPSATAEVRVDAVLTDLWMRRDRREMRVGRRHRVVVRARFSDGSSGYVGRTTELRTTDPDVVAIVREKGRRLTRIEAIAPGTAVISAFDPTTGRVTSRDLTVTVRE